jgi:hypothetical protein
LKSLFFLSKNTFLVEKIALVLNFQINMSEYDCDEVMSEEIDNKFVLIARRAQEGKTFICVSNIANDTTDSIHLIISMNTLASSMQYFGRIEDKIRSNRILVLNSKPSTAGDCHHSKDIETVTSKLLRHPEIKVIICCAHSKRIRESIPHFFTCIADSKILSKKQFVIHIDEAHAYVPTYRPNIVKFNSVSMVSQIFGYTATPEALWTEDPTDDVFYKIPLIDLRHDGEGVKYFSVKQCETITFPELHDNDDLLPELPEEIPEHIFTRAQMTSKNRGTWYQTKFPFSLGNEYLFLRFILYILTSLAQTILPNVFSYHYIPSYTRKATHYQTVDIILSQFPTANVITINGDGTVLYRWDESKGSSVKVNSVAQLRECASKKEKKDLLEPSYIIQKLIESTPNCPTFVTGYYCVSMSVTLINEGLGNFDNVIVCHPHIKDADLYQLCRFLFNYTRWSPENQSKIKQTKLYSYTQDVIDRCLGQEQFVELLCSDDFCGKTVSKQEATGKVPICPTLNEQRKKDLKSIIPENENLWRKFTVHDEDDVKDQWERATKFYQDFLGKELKGKSMPDCVDGFYHTSTTSKLGVRTIQDIENMKTQSWKSTLLLDSQKYKYARVFVGYEDLTKPYQYTIYIKYVSLPVDDKTTIFLNKWYSSKKKSKVITL